MMIILEFAFGNSKESFVEDRFGKNINIIFSNDNNKGKTLVMQGMMYAIGNEPIFPSGFEYKNYVYYLKFSIGSVLYEVFRKGDSFLVSYGNSFESYDSVSDFKYFFDSKIFPLPKIIHKGLNKKVDLSLFFQLFFVGQDKRDTSSIFNDGYFNKTNYVEMLMSFGKEDNQLEAADLDELKNKIRTLKISEAKIAKEFDRIDAHRDVIDIVKQAASDRKYVEFKNNISSLYGRLTDLRNQKNRELNRLMKYRSLQSELNSLNRTLSIGGVVCSDCGSENIKYKSKDFTFDISNREVKNNILNSIANNIRIKEEATSQLDYEESILRSQLELILQDTPPTLRDVFIYQDEMNSSKKISDELKNIREDIESLTSLLKANEKLSAHSDEGKRKLRSLLVSEMNSIYRQIDTDGIQVFDDIFSKKSANFSGSDEQEYYFSRTIAILNTLSHPFPILIDSFRDRELSTEKEVRMLDYMELLPNQIIVTATLKNLEYKEDKYQTYGRTVAIDYSDNSNSHILSQKHSKRFNEICRKAGLRLS